VSPADGLLLAGGSSVSGPLDNDCDSDTGALPSTPTAPPAVGVIGMEVRDSSGSSTEAVVRNVINVSSNSPCALNNACVSPVPVSSIPTPCIKSIPYRVFGASGVSGFSVRVWFSLSSVRAVGTGSLRV